MQNNRNENKRRGYFKPKNKDENNNMLINYSNNAAASTHCPEFQSQPNQKQPKESEKRTPKFQGLDLRAIFDLLEKTPEEIVLEMSNPGFSFDAYINDPTSFYSVNSDYIQKLLQLVGKALTCNSLKLKLSRLMSSFIESDFFNKLVYKQLESNETATVNTALAPAAIPRITGIFGLMEPNSPKEFYNELFLKSVMNVCALIVDLDPYLKTSLDPILDRLELIVKYKTNNSSLMVCNLLV